MTVVEVIAKYNLKDFNKKYKNQYGNYCKLVTNDASPIELAKQTVRGIDINFPTKEVTITIIE